MFIGFFLATTLRKSLLNCKSFMSCCLENLEKRENLKKSELREDTEGKIKIYKDIDPSKSLVFVGVMTAQKYLDSRAKSVYETWGSRIPGEISFFSRSGSTSRYDIPLVSLPGVDDSYPPQKKSFMMLKFMHDNYLDKFEWFMRVDDDVYIKPDKLEYFLRSLNSSKPQFIGQAGLGNKDEFGLLSLDYDENFCMGGPGIVMSRETLRVFVPHISYCLKNLYSTHEDVEIGRCVRKFANISCTWSYEVSIN
jgi:chondroitin sulfate synthase